MRWRDAGAYLRDSPVLGLVFCVCYASERISVGYWIGKLTRRPQDSQFYGWYVVGWLVALLLMLGLAPASGSWAIALAWLGLYRLQDMLFGTITDAFGFVRFAGSWQSKVVLAIFNIVQVVTIFAVAYLVFTPGLAFSPPPPPTRFGHFYLSWSTFPPLGSGFTPRTLRARVLGMTESAVGVLLIVIALSRFLSNPDPAPESPAAEPATPAADGGSRETG